MMRRLVLLLTVLMTLPVLAAEPLTRILWYNLESTANLANDRAGVSRHAGDYGRVFTLGPQARAAFELDASDWWRVRVYGDESAAAAPVVWSSVGDGVFFSQPVVDKITESDYTDYFYHQQTPAERLVLLENTSDADLSVSLYRTDTRSLPDHVRDAEIMLSSLHDQTTLINRTGFESHDVQFIESEQSYSTEFSEPGLYHLEIRVPWQRSFRLSELLRLSATFSSGKAGKEQSLLAQLDSENLYHDRSTDGEFWLSQPLRVPFYVTQADQKVTIDLDQDGYLRWLESDSESQFLMPRNAPRNIEQQRLRHLADESPAAVTRSFYRALPPNEVLPAQRFIPLDGQLTADHDWFLPRPRQTTRSPEYFYQLLSNQQATVELPGQVESPPVRLSLRLPDQPLQLDVRTDAGEVVSVRYFAEFDLPRRWQLTRSSTRALASSAGHPARWVSQAVLGFRKPYNSLRIDNVGEHQAWFKLEYLNERLRAPTEYSWIDSSRDSGHQPLLQLLMQGQADGANQGIVEREILNQWRSRIETRAGQFAARYPAIAETAGEAPGKKQFARLKASLSSNFSVPVDDPEDVYQQLLSLGYNITARQLMVAFATGVDSSVQGQAEEVLLQALKGEGRWFDVEGYWAWRMLRMDDSRAPAEIAFSWTQQQRESEAAQLFWLLEQAPQPDFDRNAAIAAAWLSEQYAMFEHWLSQLSPQQQRAWRCLTVNRDDGCQNAYQGTDLMRRHWLKQQPEFYGATREAVIYNQALDQYLSTFFLQSSTSVKALLEPAKRLKLTVYPSVEELASSADPLKQLTVKVNQTTYSLAVRLDTASDSLVWSQRRDKWVVSPQSFELELEQAASSVTLETRGFDAAVVIELAVPVAEMISQRLAMSDQSDRLSLDTAQPLVKQAQADHQSTASSELTVYLSEMLLQQQRGELTEEQIKRIKYQLAGRSLTDQQQFLLSRLTRDYRWQRLDAVGESDGIAYLQSDRWQPRSAWLKMRNALMVSAVKKGERRLSSAQTSSIEVTLESPSQLSLTLRMASEIAMPQSPVEAVITTPGGEQRVQVSRQRQKISLPLKAGRHIIRLALAEPSDNIILYQLTNKQGRSLLPASQVKTYRASAEKDIRLFVPANNLLRIEKYQNKNGQAEHSYQWFNQDRVSTIRHSGTSEHSYYRFFLWQPGQQDALPDVEEPQQQQLAAAPAPQVWPVRGQSAVFQQTVHDLGEQEDGTWGFDVGYRMRNNFDEDTRSPQEKYIDTRWTYQHHLESWQAYWDSSIQWRKHNGNDLQTLVSTNRLNWLPSKYFDFEANLNLYYQASADSAQVQGAWSGYGSVSGRWSYFWNNRSRNDLELTLFGRELSEQQRPAAAVDDDIVTQYKIDHQYGLTLRDRFYYQPWLDTRVHLGGELSLNEFDQSSLLEKWSVESGWRQYWEPWRLGVDARYTRYLADQDRQTASSSTVLGISLDYDLWQQNGNLWQFAFDLRHDLNRNSTGLFFGVSWNNTDGQGYQDVAPRRRAFSSLRRQYGLRTIESNDITEAADAQ